MFTTFDTRTDANGNSFYVATATHAGQTYRTNPRRHKVYTANHSRADGPQKAAELLAADIHAGTARPLSDPRALENGPVSDNGRDMARQLLGPAEYDAIFDDNVKHSVFLKIAAILSHADRLAPRFHRHAEYLCNGPAELDRPGLPQDIYNAAIERHARHTARQEAQREKAEARIAHALERVAPGRFVLHIGGDPRGAIVQAWDLSRLPEGIEHTDSHAHAFATGVPHFRRQIARDRAKSRNHGILMNYHAWVAA